VDAFAFSSLTSYISSYFLPQSKPRPLHGSSGVFLYTQYRGIKPPFSPASLLLSYHKHFSLQLQNSKLGHACVLDFLGVLTQTPSILPVWFCRLRLNFKSQCPRNMLCPSLETQKHEIENDTKTTHGRCLCPKRKSATVLCACCCLARSTSVL
jgi:hypothetical protein